MFDYEGLTDDQINALGDQSDSARLYAILMIIHGMRKNILTSEEGLRQIQNLTLSIMES